MTAIVSEDAKLAQFMVVVDPLSRKLRIPRDAFFETRAMQRQGTPSLCMLFLEGRCRQGPLCHQAHAKLEVVAELRQQALQLPSCCVEHGDLNTGNISPKWSKRCLDVHGVKVSMKSVAYTASLQRVMEETREDVVSIPSSMVCRLHAATRCRYSEDCKFIHICREIIQNQLSNYVAPLVPELEARFSSKNHPPPPMYNQQVPVTPPIYAPAPAQPMSQPMVIVQQMSDGTQQMFMVNYSQPVQQFAMPETVPMMTTPYIPSDYTPMLSNPFAFPQYIPEQSRVKTPPKSVETCSPGTGSWSVVGENRSPAKSPAPQELNIGAAWLPLSLAQEICA